MPDLVEVFIDITLEEVSGANMIKRVAKALRKIKGVYETHYTEGTNKIMGFAKWQESEIPDKVKEIKNITGVKNVDAKILIPI